jgi:hypothetical protein
MRIVIYIVLARLYLQVWYLTVLVSVGATVQPVDDAEDQQGVQNNGEGLACPGQDFRRSNRVGRPRVSTRQKQNPQDLLRRLLL